MPARHPRARAALSPAFEALARAHVHANPMVAAAIALTRLEQAGALDLEMLMLIQDVIERALEQGPDEAEDTRETMRQMITAPPAAGRSVPEGF